MDTLGHLSALHVAPANNQGRTQVVTLAQAVQKAMNESVELVDVDRG